MPFVINVPEELGDKNLPSFFRGWNWLDNPPDQKITLNVQRGTHIAPWAATLFATYAIWLKEVRGRDVELTYDPDTYVGKFLQRIGLPQLLGSGDHPHPVPNQRIFPLTRITDSKQIAKVASSLVEMLKIDDTEVEDAIKYSLIELLRNVVQHSRSRIGGIVSAVFFPSTGLVDVIVADVGCGIKTTLRDTYPEITNDQKAVKFAMQPHVSGTFKPGMYQSMKDNAGLGLFFIREIATHANGGFFLGSGRMLADVWGEEDGTEKRKYFETSKTGSGWRGTFAVLQLRRESIGEFGSLLGRCREIAAQVQKSRTSLSVEFLDEQLELEGLLTILIKDIEEDVEAAALVRDDIILPTLASANLVLLDFTGVRAATQSFIHALMYKLFRDGQYLELCLSICCADKATEQAIRAVSAYATTEQQ